MSADPWRAGYGLAILRRLRFRTQKDLAAAAGVDLIDLINFESGAEEPDAETVARLVAAMGYNPEEVKHVCASLERIKREGLEDRGGVH
jgi:transcriptional regulator with XRE-family HTH domain